MNTKFEEKPDTNLQFDTVIKKVRELFVKKNSDYGSTTWLMMRTKTLTDQLFIKAQRIRTISEGTQKVKDTTEDELIGIINYSVMGLIKIHHSDINIKTKSEVIFVTYDEEIQKTKELMFAKNHDYGEAWREMRIESICDLILIKILRTKMIEDNGGKTIASEGVDANYRDMINYAIFALILMEEKKI